MTNDLVKLHRMNGFRYYGLNGAQVNKIHIFNKVGIILTINRGWFEGKRENGFGNVDIQSIEITEPALKRKVDFGMKQNFYISVKSHYRNEKLCELYIMESECNLQVLEDDAILYKTPSSNAHGAIYSFDLNGNRFTSEHFKYMKETALGTETRNVGEMLADAGIKMSSYEIELLLKNFNITKKE
jgi:hypothetical protein